MHIYLCHSWLGNSASLRCGKIGYGQVSCVWNEAWCQEWAGQRRKDFGFYWVQTYLPWQQFSSYGAWPPWGSHIRYPACKMFTFMIYNRGKITRSSNEIILQSPQHEEVRSRVAALGRLRTSFLQLSSGVTVDKSCPSLLSLLPSFSSPLPLGWSLTHHSLSWCSAIESQLSLLLEPLSFLY